MKKMLPQSMVGCAALVIATQALSSCLSRNDVQDLGIIRLEQRVLAIECKAMERTVRGKEMIRPSDGVVTVDATTMGIPRTTALKTRSGLRAWLIPDHPDWQGLLDLAQRRDSYGFTGMLTWPFIGRLIRVARLSDKAYAFEFDRVPEGNYDLVARWIYTDAAGPEYPVRYASVRVEADGGTSVTPYDEIPDPKRGYDYRSLLSNRQ